MPFDAQQAAKKYIDGIGEETLQTSYAYTMGNHWILLWGLLISAITTFVIIRTGLLDKMLSKLESRHQFVRHYMVALLYLLLATFLGLPWDIYTDWYREKSYGLTSQPLGDYLGQLAGSTVIILLVASLFLSILYLMIHRTGRLWWIWASGLVSLFTVITLLLFPLFIEPLFNEFKPLPEGEVRAALEAQAKTAGIAPDRILIYDGSRQSNNFTANVAGIGPAARIAISDIALKGASLDEVIAVTGHEIGHYVGMHSYRSIAIITLVAFLIFWLTAYSFSYISRIFGNERPLNDIRTIPLFLFIIGLYSTLLSPALNYVSRIGEEQADIYSLQTVNLPDALASALVKTAEYRYPRPGRLEEFLFYTHPSVERRVLRAMEWKARQNTPGANQNEEGNE